MVFGDASERHLLEEAGAGRAAALVVALDSPEAAELVVSTARSLYPALHRLDRRGWIKARWGTSENNRRARYYELTKAGRKQLETETGLWKQLTAAVNQVLGEA